MTDTTHEFQARLKCLYKHKGRVDATPELCKLEGIKFCGECGSRFSCVTTSVPKKVRVETSEMTFATYEYYALSEDEAIQTFDNYGWGIDENIVERVNDGAGDSNIDDRFYIDVAGHEGNWDKDA